MDKSLTKDYLIEFSEKELPELRQRELKVPVDKKFSVSIIGPRRAGKTFYFYQLIKKTGKEKVIYLNFEDTRLSDVNFREIRDIIRQYIEMFGKSPKYIFLDEIQNVEHWEKSVREIQDTAQYYILLTGSSSKLLSKEISTQMRGRTLTYLLLPFSFTEFLTCRNFKYEKLTRDSESLIRYLLKEYLEFGGYPDVVTSNLKEKILKEYFDSILFKDIVERHNVKNLHLVNLIFKQLINSFSCEFSVNAIYNTFKSQGAKVSKDSLYKYLNYFEDSVAVFFLRRYSDKSRLREAWPRKVYLCDTGLSKLLRFSEDIGKLMENCVFLHLLRMKNNRPLIDVSYYRAQDGSEVDFVVKEGNKIIELIQVTYASEYKEIRAKEIRSLISAGKQLKCKNLSVITWDYENIKNDVSFVPIWKWLVRIGLK